MSAMRLRGGELERLVDRHIELCELFGGRRPPGRRDSPVLITMNDGKASIECLADLVDRAIVAYEDAGCAEDRAIFALKVALVDAIFEMA
jgi:hypothetical protein